MKITDDLLYQHSAEARDIWLEHMPKDEEIAEHQFSESFDKKMDALILRKKKKSMFYRVMQSAAAVLAIVFLGTGTILAVDVDARESFFGWIKETYETFYVYRFSDDIDLDIEPKDYKLPYIPEGYTEFMSQDTGDMIMNLYADEEGRFLKFFYIYEPSGTNMFVDMTDTVLEKTTINGYEAELLISHNDEISSCIMWTDKDNAAFNITAFMSKEQLIELAEAVSEQYS